MKGVPTDIGTILANSASASNWINLVDDVDEVVDSTYYGFQIIATGYAAAGQPLWHEETLYRADVYEFRNRISGGYRLVLVREPAGPIQFRVRLAEGNDFPDVRVIEVVDGNDERRPSTEGYGVSFERTRGAE